MSIHKRTIVGPIIVACLLLTPPIIASQEYREIISVDKKEFAEKKLSVLGLDLLLEKDDRIYIVASPQDILSLVHEDVPFTFETHDFQPAGSAGIVTTGGINGAYHSYFELEGDLFALQENYPHLARIEVIGESLEKRNIYALKISDNPHLDEDEAKVLYLGCHHAREWISVEVPFLFGKSLLEDYATDSRIRGLVDSSEIWIVPLVNPDGLEYSIHVYRYWRKNRRLNADGSYGVDLNRNYGYMWGHDDEGSSPAPGSNTYRGPEPFSEPETQAVKDLFAERGFQAMISFHSYSQIILYPWSYIDEPTVKDEELESIAARMSQLMETVRGTVYDYDRGASGLYVSNGDTTDWSFGVSGIPSYTVELPPIDVQHGGFFNAEAEIDGIFRENRPAMLYLGEYAVEHFDPIPARVKDLERLATSLLIRVLRPLRFFR